MKIEYINDYQVAIDGETIIKYLLPQCPACKKAPTYNMNPCPFCGQELEYPEDVEVSE